MESIALGKINRHAAILSRSERATFARRFASGLLLVAAVSTQLPAAEPDLAEALQSLNASVLTQDAEKSALRDLLANDVTARIREANARETQAWNAVKTREDWERLRDTRIAALKRSLGTFPPEHQRDLQIRKTGELSGNGYRIEKLVYESRPGLLVTGNLYVPTTPPASMPGILICHSHHNPKTQSELQDMGILWARLGCLVLVIDQVGHGERRQHPFRTAADYPGEFRVGRQDYHFRYNVALQLHLVGESLAGWMAWDMLRGIDLLLEQPGIDRNRIILLGSVAGGGDPVAVTAALDPRITCVVPFNFGGPQPETRSPLPEDAEARFNYAGGGSWESTRNLRLSARDGFLPWVIVGSVAPRALIYAHEFRWDQPRDPVWKRLQAIFGMYDVPDRLAFSHGFGTVQGQPPDASHCNNIGAIHRKMIYPALERWFQIAPPEKENQDRHSAEELLCLVGPEANRIRLTPVHRLCSDLGERQHNIMELKKVDFDADQRRNIQRKIWLDVLGNVAPYTPQVKSLGTETLNSARIERFVLTGERNIQVPFLLLTPEKSGAAEGKRPLVMMVAQAGKGEFLKQRAKPVAELLAGGVAVCLPDLRGTGETRPGDGRGRRSEATSLSATELMLGDTLVGARLRDLRSLLSWLRLRDGIDGKRVALWGDSFAPVNAADRELKVPLDVANEPVLAEPLGPLLALLGGLFDEELVAIVCARGGLINFQSVLQSQFVYAPHDVLVPGALATGDLPVVAEAISPRPVWMGGLVDGLNRAAEKEDVQSAYGGEQAPAVLNGELEKLPGWLLEQVSKK